MEIIPAIDLIGGKCVRLTKGDYNTKKIYSEDPLAIAKDFELHGFKRLHLVDLDGAKSGKVINIEVLKRIASQTKLVIDFGGGVKTEEEFVQVLENGAQMVNFGSLAVKNKNLLVEWARKYGNEKIIVGADSFNKKISIAGWMDATSIDIFDFIKGYILEGFNHFLCTDISKDGMMQGSSIELYKEILRYFPDIRLIASGGVSSLDEITKLEEIGVHSAIIGKAFYEGIIKPEELKKYNN